MALVRASPFCRVFSIYVGDGCIARKKGHLERWPLKINQLIDFDLGTLAADQTKCTQED